MWQTCTSGARHIGNCMLVDLAGSFSYSCRQIDTDSPEEQAMALGALEQSLDHLQKQFGNTDVRWGNVNMARKARA